jgi:hypothetical protein
MMLAPDNIDLVLSLQLFSLISGGFGDLCTHLGLRVLHIHYQPKWSTNLIQNPSLVLKMWW